MQDPVSTEKSVAILGTMLGVFPPAAILVNFVRNSFFGWLLIGLFVVGIVVTALVGYQLGRIVARVLSKLEQKDWVTMTVLLMLVGGSWGAVSGIAGGTPILVVGAIAGGFI